MSTDVQPSDSPLIGEQKRVKRIKKSKLKIFLFNIWINFPFSLFISFQFVVVKLKLKIVTLFLRRHTTLTIMIKVNVNGWLKQVLENKSIYDLKIFRSKRVTIGAAVITFRYFIYIFENFSLNFVSCLL